MSASYEERRAVMLKQFDADNPQLAGKRCHGASDGECIWKSCPQLRDDEPHKTGRHCPLDRYGDDD